MKSPSPGSALLPGMCRIKQDSLNASEDELEMLFQKSSLVSRCISYIDLFM